MAEEKRKEITLDSQYERQFKWRDWKTIFSLLPIKEGDTVLDLGCARGDQSMELSRLGAKVIGIDGDKSLLRVAISRNIPGATFHLADLSDISSLMRSEVDGIWTSFLPAYFPEFSSIAAKWSLHLKPGGWVAAVEMDNLFGHAPISNESQDLITGFYEHSRRSGHYDFCMGGRLRQHLERAGFKVEAEKTIADFELSFQGPAAPEILEAWENRLARMSGLKHFANERFLNFHSDFMKALSNEEHKSFCRVVFILARK